MGYAPSETKVTTKSRIQTLGDSLHWSYANLAMAHAAVSGGAAKYGMPHFVIRNRLFTGLQNGTMKIGALADDERLKLVLPQACCYCTSRTNLSVDHVIARIRGGMDAGDNMVWACRSCNSSKGAKDLLVWMAARGEFPPLLLLRRYLKLAIQYCAATELLGVRLGGELDVPFAIDRIPHKFPAPGDLVLWKHPL